MAETLTDPTWVEDHKEAVAETYYKRAVDLGERNVVISGSIFPHF